MPSSRIDRTDNIDEMADITYQLSGRTLKVYWWLMTQRDTKNRLEVQRGTNLSSPSLASYHLKKLKSMGLVEETIHGEYKILKEVRVGVTKFFFILLNRMIPRFLLYATFYAVTIFGILCLSNSLPSPILIFIMLVLLFGFITSLFEASVLIRSSP